MADTTTREQFGGGVDSDSSLRRQAAVTRAAAVEKKVVWQRRLMILIGVACVLLALAGALLPGLLLYTGQTLADWRWQAFAIGCLTVLAVACLLITMAAKVRQLRLLSAAQTGPSPRSEELEKLRDSVTVHVTTLRETERALRANESVLLSRIKALTTTLQHVDQGIMMIDSDNRVSVYNQRALDVLGLPESLLADRPLFDDVVAYQSKHGEFRNVRTDIGEFIQSAGISHTPHRYERERPNGTIIEGRSLPLPKGGMVRTFTDITERKKAEAQIERTALFDDATGLPNRFSLRRSLDTILAAEPNKTSLLYINLDKFRLLNGALGYVTGDALLQAVAGRLREMAMPGDFVSRPGGDEFAILHRIDTAEDNSSEVSASLLQRLSEPYTIGDQRVTVTASVGIAIGSPGTTTDMLLRNADIAMHRAKDGGRNQTCRYEPAMAAAQQEHFAIEQSLREAQGTSALKLAYQPIISLETNTISGFEALLRWHDARRGEISPSTFIPMAEANGLIIPLGRSVLDWACTEASSWSTARTIAVNLSPVQFHGDNLVNLVKSVLMKTGLAPEQLELEVTEGILLEDTGAVKQTMGALRDIGVSLTLDDFGTGHAGLSYLRRFPFQKFKIDRSFVRNLGRSHEADAIVEEMLLLARRLDLRVVAEGVELKSQLEQLRNMGCPYIQGFFTGRPLPPEVARKL